MLDYQFRLLLVHATGTFDPDTPLVEIVVQTAFTFTDADGVDHVIEPEDPSTVGPAMRLLRQTLERVTAWKDGRLELAFESGASVLVPPHGRFESYDVSGPGFKLIGLPSGGEPAIWLSGE